MKIKYKSIENIKERPAIHKSHIADNSFEADESTKMIVVEGEHNRFPLVISGGHATILRPYEGKIKDDISEVVNQVKVDYAQTHLYGFPLNELNKYFNIVSERSNLPITWYQTPLSTEVYNQKLKKFKDKGLEFEILSKNEIPQLKELIKNWSTLKKDSAFTAFELEEIKSPKNIEESIAKLQALQNEVEWMDFKEEDDIFYQKRMKQPITTFYGAFKGGQLVAYSEVQANSNFASFEKRGAIRQNSFSPQEFVDYMVMKILSKDGVKILDRGPINLRKGAHGLMKYKTKFGPLKALRETNYHNVHIVNNPLFDMAKEMQGNPFESI